MDILITMVYTAAMTFIATKVVEHTPTQRRKKACISDGSRQNDLWNEIRTEPGTISLPNAI